MKNINYVIIALIETLIEKQFVNLTETINGDASIKIAFQFNCLNLKNEILKIVGFQKNSYISIIQYRTNGTLLACISCTTEDVTNMNTCKKWELVIKPDFSGFILYQILNNQSKVELNFNI